MQEQIMDLSGELDAQFEAYVSAGGNDVDGVTCFTNMFTCETLACTGVGCTCLP